MAHDPRFDVIRERADRAIDGLSDRLAALEREIADARAELETLTPRAKVHYRYVRCSADCNCNDGRGHGPYAYASFRDADGRARKRYLGKSPNVPEGTVDKGVYREKERRLSALCAERDRLWEQIGQALDCLEASSARSSRRERVGTPVLTASYARVA